jgi:hypothetical protein
MPFPRAHTRIAWSGIGWNSQEEWSTGLRLDSVAVPTAAQMSSLSAAFVTLYNSAALQTSSGLTYLGLKAAPVTVDGKYPAGASAVEWVHPTGIGTSHPSGLPQATIAVTFTTATKRGLANEGRMFLPATSLTPSSDGRITNAQATSIANAVVSFVNAVDAVGVGSATVFSQVREGAARDITGVRVGRVIDTQRRRRNNIAEMYVTAATGPT